jgi:hypothetical protein
MSTLLRLQKIAGMAKLVRVEVPERYIARYGRSVGTAGCMSARHEPQPRQAPRSRRIPLR